ncbi:MAG: alpha/beta hydrolase [Methanobrevibacter thaueri]|jgi:pimeloyl-ACP methyl ester carboxylesterase|uniref:alpha/beta fold hydrolase n=1 Tax=Methanobrevibacter thaueri TaxID=190975 RepID=UPI0026E95501|nr:alpha/beta hydrolase [Methanobrevibacter thaueri]MBE6496422.1 alpha/beta hydrolase [Methanobrevibacter thaueri]
MKLNYVDEGNGETLVLIHGLSDNLLYWEVLATALKKDFRVVRFDLRGHGQSPLGEDEITMGTYVNDLKNILDELNIKKASLIGFSLGGAVALDFAVKYPDYVSSMVLMSTFSKCDDHVVDMFNQFNHALEGGFETFYDFMVPKVLCPDVIESNREELEFLKQIASKTANVDAFKKAVDACMDFNVDDELSQIDVPVLVLCGKYDEIFPMYIHKNISCKINNSKLIVLDNSRHNLLVGENNIKVIDALNDFLKKEKK